MIINICLFEILINSLALFIKLSNFELSIRIISLIIVSNKLKVLKCFFQVLIYTNTFFIILSNFQIDICNCFFASYKFFAVFQCFFYIFFCFYIILIKIRNFKLFFIMFLQILFFSTI